MAPIQLTKFKAAAAHAAPVFMDKAASIKKVVSLIEQAAQEDIKLVVFPETFVPGYPVCDGAFPIARASTPYAEPLRHGKVGTVTPHIELATAGAVK